MAKTDQPTVTPRQLEILRLIRDFRSRRGYSPTMQELGDQLGLTKVTVFEHVGALERKGLLVRGAKHKARSLRVSNDFEFPEDAGAGILLVGRIAAGAPIEAIENPEVLELDAIFNRGDGTFVLEVTGDSMADEHIRDGDYVVCQKRNTARDGEVVVALIEDGEATLKTFYKEGDRIRLQPANVNYQPIYPRQIEIQGVVIGVIRRL